MSIIGALRRGLAPSLRTVRALSTAASTNSNIVSQEADGRPLTWFMKEYWGFKNPPTKGIFSGENRVNALMSVAASDGKLSKAEREWISGYFEAMGSTPEQLKSLQTKSPDSLETTIKSLEKAERDAVASGVHFRCTRRPLLFTSIQAAKADQLYGSDEREAVSRLANMLGISQAVVEQMEKCYDDERELNKRRQALCFPDGMPATAQAATWIMREYWGFKSKPTDNVLNGVFHALLAVANGEEGVISTGELEWIRGYAGVMGVTGFAFDTLLASTKSSRPSIEAAADAILALEITSRTPLRKQIIFDSVRAASADGYSLGERRALRDLAGMLDIPVELCRALEQCYQDEKFIRTRRLRLCYPDGLPF